MSLQTSYDIPPFAGVAVTLPINNQAYVSLGIGVPPTHLLPNGLNGVQLSGTFVSSKGFLTFYVDS